MPSPRQGAVRVKTPKTRELETHAKIKRIRVRLEEIAEYKRVLAVDGLQPDVDDKRLESELIVRLLYLEKELKNMAPEALALKAREHEEEEARNATVAAASPLKRRQSEPRRAFDSNSARPAPTDAAKKPFAPRAEPWRSPYAAEAFESAPKRSTGKPVGGSQRPAGKKAEGRTASRSDNRAYTKPADGRSDKRPSSYGKPAEGRSDKRPSPYAKPSDSRGGDGRGDKRPSPYAKPSDSRGGDGRGDKRPSPYAKPSDSRGGDGRGDKRPKPTEGRGVEGRSEQRPGRYAKPAEGSSRGDRRPSPYAKTADGRSGKGPSPHGKAAGRGDRPSPHAKKPVEKRYAKPKAKPDARDESTSLTPAGEKKGYWSRDDRRVRSGKRLAGRPTSKN